MYYFQSGWFGGSVFDGKYFCPYLMELYSDVRFLKAAQESNGV